MKKITDSSFFNSILQYNNQHEERIKDICSPLKACFDITYFGYCRFFDDGRYLLISNCTPWKEGAFFYDFFFNTEFFKILPQYFSKYEPQHIIWPENGVDQAIEFLKDRKVYNGFNIFKENVGTIECYFFGADHGSSLIKDFYRSHIHTLEDFTHYFHKIAGELVDSTDVARQGIFPFIKNQYPQIETIFKNTTPWEESIIKFNTLLNSHVEEEINEIGRRHLLTPRELQCLSHFSRGMTAKEIAQRFNLGFRTVETHLNNIRLKTGCHTKRELTYWFEDKFKYFLTL